MPHLLELFSGTGSVGDVFRREGWDVTSVDLDPRAGPTICADLLTLDLARLPAHVDAVWASPPCTHYSRARTTARTPRDLLGSDALVRRALEIVARYPRAAFWIENPATGLLKTRDVLQAVPRALVSYCAYAGVRDPKYRKDTHIWTNTLDWWEPRPLCRAARRCPWFDGEAGRHTDTAQRAGGWSRDELYRVPSQLCAELARAWRARYGEE